MLFTGFLLLGYGILVSTKSGYEWHVLDSIADFLSRLLTLIGTILVALSAYYCSSRPADKHSKIIVAPLIILLVLGAAVWWFFEKDLSHYIFNGFSMIAIACSILRSLPFSEWES